MIVNVIESYPGKYTYVLELVTKDPTEYNLFRLAMYKQIKTYRVYYVTIDVNTSDLTSPKIAGRLSRCPIEQTEEMINGTFDDSKGFTFDVIGPAEFTTSDINGIKFHRETPIAYIADNKRICGYLEVRPGYNKDHPCFSPVSRIGIIRDGSDDGNTSYLISVKTKGMLNIEDIVKKTIEGMYAEINDTSDRYDQTIIYSDAVKNTYQFRDDQR